MDSEKVRVLIADDHPLYRDGCMGYSILYPIQKWMARPPAAKILSG